MGAAQQPKLAKFRRWQLAKLWGRNAILIVQGNYKRSGVQEHLSPVHRIEVALWMPFAELKSKQQQLPHWAG